MRMVDLIHKKQAHDELTEQEIKWMIEEYTTGNIPDYQMSAMLMAIYFQAMTPKERADLTIAMAESGDQMDFSAIKGTTVDKHSTGGVGDTTTFVIVPLVASVGVPVPKMSGRGLGHTGGTIDKLEAIPGFNTAISGDEFTDLVNANSAALVGQTGNLAPADKKIYALRDVTSTVESIPLIASSIMSKKLASGADAIVLDVKTGEGAFMETLEDARTLAKAMLDIGKKAGRHMLAVISDMSQPLGYAIGNGLEVQEAIDTLKGEGPDDLTELSLVLAAQMAYLGGAADSFEEAKELMQKQIDNGEAFEQFKKIVKGQGGDVSYIEHPEKFAKASHISEVKATTSGYISRMIADEIGVASMLLGAGRETMESDIDLSAGIILEKKVGDEVQAGDVLAVLHTNKADTTEAERRLQEAIIIGEKVDAPPLIHEILN